MSDQKGTGLPKRPTRAMEAAKTAGKVIVKDVIADAFLQNTLLIPEEYSVIATLNLNGDYISDQLAAMVGGIGIAPGANINYLTGHAIFEATHGTAPNIAGKDTVNPSSLLLSAVMMLEYLGWKEAALLITGAMESSFEAGRATGDLARFMPAVRRSPRRHSAKSCSAGCNRKTSEFPQMHDCPAKSDGQESNIKAVHGGTKNLLRNKIIENSR